MVLRGLPTLVLLKTHPDVAPVIAGVWHAQSVWRRRLSGKTDTLAGLVAYTPVFEMPGPSTMLPIRPACGRCEHWDAAEYAPNRRQRFSVHHMNDCALLDELIDCKCVSTANSLRYDQAVRIHYVWR